MLLITMKEWIGPGRKMSDLQAECGYRSEGHIAFATQLTLNVALARIVTYQSVFNAKSVLGLTLSLLHVSEIDDISVDLLDNVQVRLVEDLPQSQQEFDM